MSMTPNTRQWKSRLSKQLTTYIQQLDISKEDKVDVMTLLLKQLNLCEAMKFQRKPTKAGRKLTSLTTRKLIWEFWHSHSTFSTITSRPAKLRVTDKKHIQSGLDFLDTVNIISQ